MLKTVATVLGGIALLAATLIDTLAVIGRHVGIPLTGSIELMQAAILFSASIGLVIATGDTAHARVRLLVDRLGPLARKLADGFSDGLTLLFFLALLIGSGWLAIDLWDGHEQSEILGVPWRALRFFANAGLLFAAVLIATRMLRRREP